MSIRGFDHVAIPIQNVDAMLAFYRALGFGVQDKGQVYSVHFGHNKINFHTPDKWHSDKFILRGPTAKPGCGDFCFVWDGNAESAKALIEQAGAKIIAGPVERLGGRDNGRAKATSFYFRDPDENLLEFMIYQEN